MQVAGRATQAAQAARPIQQLQHTTAPPLGLAHHYRHSTSALRLYAMRSSSLKQQVPVDLASTAAIPQNDDNERSPDETVR